MPTMLEDDENLDPDDPAEQGKYGERDTLAGRDLRDSLDDPDDPDDRLPAARQSQR